MSDDARDTLETALGSVDPSRRSFLRHLLTAAGIAAALAVPASRALADEASFDEPGKGKGKGKGKKKGKGKGKGKGKKKAAF